jgi:hypothetical protein
MHALLLAAVLAVGSGDGRNGATDGRTVEKVPPYTLLRVGMTEMQVLRLMGRRSDTLVLTIENRANYYRIWRLGADEWGVYRMVVVTYDRADIIEAIQVSSYEPAKPDR